MTDAVASWAPTGTTRTAAVIGTPIRHSRSPAIHNAAFRALGLDWAFVAFEVAAGEGAAAAAAMRVLGVDGLSVTMPHKDDVIAALDELTADAEALHAVNCIERRGATLIGHNTDGPGFLAGVREASSFDPHGERCVVLGAGGAARAIVLALHRAGAADVAVVNRTREKAEVAASLAGAHGRVGSAEDVGAAALLVNATSVGMGASGSDAPLPIDADLLHDGLVVADIVMTPLETPLLREAAARGARTVDGLGMLVHQAAIAFTIWTGHDAPIDAMTAAARLTG